MAVAYESIQNNSATNASTVQVTKPASVAIYELLVAVITNGGKNDPATAATCSGWTQLTNTNSTAGSFVLDTTVLVRVATAADVAASNYTFDVTNTTDVILASIMRFSGSFGTIAGATESDADTGGAGGSNTYTGGVTPDESTSILVNIATTGGTNSNTHTGYAVANNNPSWTERADYGANYDDGTTDDYLYMGIATGSYASAGATGNYTNENSNVGVDNAHGALVAVSEDILNANVNGSVGTLTLTGNTTALGMAITGSVGTLNLTGNTGSVSAGNAEWQNKPKT